MVSTIVYSQPSPSHDTTTCQGRTSFSPLQIKALNTRFLYGQLGTVAAGQLLTPATLCLVFHSGKLSNCAPIEKRRSNGMYPCSSNMQMHTNKSIYTATIPLLHVERPGDFNSNVSVKSWQPIQE